MENEIKQQLDRISTEFKQEADKATKQLEEMKADKAAKADLEAIKQQMMEKAEEAEKQIAALKEAAEKQGTAIQGLKEVGFAAPKNWHTELTETIKANSENLGKLKSGEFQGKLNMVVKAAGTMATTNIVPSVATAIPYSLVSADGEGITRIARRRTRLREILNARPVSSMYVWWAEQANPDGGVDTVAEGAAKPKVDFDIVEKTQKVEKVAGHVKTSKEILDDVDGIRNFIDEELGELTEIKFDDQILSGNGTSPNLKGLLTWAGTASVASTPFATANTGVNFANNWDVLSAVMAIMATNSFFQADTILLNPMDYALMSMVKTTDGLYIMHPLVTAEGQRAAGIRIQPTANITAGTFVVLDSTKVSLRIREEFNVTAGYENDDFTKNLVTFVGEMRGILYVKTNYAGAVVKGTFATVAAAMETA